MRIKSLNREQDVGTSDVSILDMGDGVFEVRSTAGDSLIGGDNFDEKIIELLVQIFKDENGVDLLTDSGAAQRLKEAAEKAKVELSSTTSTEINLPYIYPVNGMPKHLVYTLTRAKFESLIDPYLVKLRKLCEQVLSDSGFKKSEISEVVLVGGSTRVPSVANVVKEVFGKEPCKSVNPDEAVSLGACVQGGVLSGDVTDILLLDVMPISLGIETMGGVMTKMIDANTTIPVTKSQVYTTASDNQASVEIHILQGERAMARDNKTLGRFHLDGIPMASRGVPQIEVTLDIDANGVLNVSAQDKGTGKKQSIRIEGSSNLSDSEVERMRNEAKINEEADKKAKEEIDIRNGADSMIFNTEKQIKEMADKLTESEKTEITELISNLNVSKTGTDIDKIKADTEAISNKWNLISVRLYQETQGNTQPQPEPEQTDNTNFEDVK